ncbi:helix-turn-helix domain-containing protein [Pseudonocardia acaciae]|uniref:helix-turn-helix domain-containing protein n=1 Tax=Pseudonocardia acaciae TaxID=551276 RepID=UPI00048C1C05|nr:helix-turn-helix domain-containing protein [Pseudonocardia acaciae]
MPVWSPQCASWPITAAIRTVIELVATLSRLAGMSAVAVILIDVPLHSMFPLLLEAARARGRRGGRPPVADADKRRIVLARHADGESIRTIARATKLSVGTVHNVVSDHGAAAAND